MMAYATYALALFVFFMFWTKDNKSSTFRTKNSAQGFATNMP